MDENSLSTYLHTHGVNHQLIQVRGSCKTAAEAAAELGVRPGEIVKSLVCRLEDTALLALIPGNRTLSLDKLGTVLGASEVALASRRLVEHSTGYRVGAVAPLDLATPMRVLGDSRLGSLHEVYCGGGSDRHMLKIGVADLERLAQVEWMDISADPYPPGSAKDSTGGG